MDNTKSALNIFDQESVAISEKIKNHVPLDNDDLTTLFLLNILMEELNEK
jgi:hypothetical protein